MVGIVTGSTAYIKTLDSLDPVLRDIVIKDASRGVARRLNATIKKQAPVDTGDLRKASRVRALRKRDPARDEGFEFVVSRGKSSGSYQAYILNYGTQERFHRSGKSVGRIAPNPYIARSVDIVAPEATSIFEQEGRKSQNKLNTRLNKRFRDLNKADRRLLLKLR